MNVRTEDEKRCLLGIDFGGTKVAVAVAGLDGRILLSQRLRTESDRGAAQALERTLELAKDLVTRSGRRLAAVGVATPGVVRPDRIELAPNVPGWESLSLAAAVGAELGVDRVDVGNDLNAAALAEVTTGALRDADPGLVVGLGTGVAVAVTVGGVVVEGFHGAAGEVAYALVGSGAIRAGEPQLEETFSGRALDRIAERRGVDGGAAGLDVVTPGPVSTDVGARVDDLARHLVTCCLLLDPQRVVLVGGVSQNLDIRGQLSRRLKEHLPFAPEVVLSGTPGDAALIGAVALARRALG